jgi:hypothetical protein
MTRRTVLALATLLFAPALSPASAQTPVDGRIVRVVYEVIFNGPGPRGSTWGFHLAHMNDGRYCVRFGNPGRLNLAIIQRVGDICFDRIPGTVDRSGERRSESFDAREKGKRITVVSYQKVSIQVSGDDITLQIATCNRVEGEQETRCFPNLYVVHMSGPACSAEVTLSDSNSRAGATTCEHYEAR